MSDSLSEFSNLVDELSELVKEWQKLPPLERAQKEELFRNRHKEIADRFAGLTTKRRKKP